MVIQRAIGRNGSDYFYFFCRARQEDICTSRHLPIDAVEDAVIDHYRTVQLRPEFIGFVEGQVDDALDDQVRAQREWKNQLEMRRNELDAKAANLVELVADGGLAVELAKQRLRQIEVDRADIDTQLATVVRDLSAGVEYLKGWLELLRDPHTLYVRASNEMRRRLNQAIFVRIFIADEGRVASELSEPARLLLEAQSRWQSMHSGDGIGSANATAAAGLQEQTTTDKVDGWSKDYLVEHIGFEPMTSSMPWKRASQLCQCPVLDRV
jgi:site-specific DNA recombinase